MLKNKVIVITGGSKGLGKGLAFEFIKNNSTVIICSRNKEELLEASKEINAVPIVCDVTKESEVQKLAEAVIKQFGRIDIWINNAGIWLPKVFIEETDWTRVHEMFEVNLFGTVYGSKMALLQMRKQNFGTIVNIISTSALSGRAKSSGYCASKYAQNGFTESLRKELEGTTIKVISVFPGGMKTNLFDEGKPEDFDNYMNVEEVSNKIIHNLNLDVPEEQLVIRRPV